MSTQAIFVDLPETEKKQHINKLYIPILQVVHLLYLIKKICDQNKVLIELFLVLGQVFLSSSSAVIKHSFLMSIKINVLSRKFIVYLFSSSFLFSADMLRIFVCLISSIHDQIVSGTIAVGICHFNSIMKNYNLTI